MSLGVGAVLVLDPRELGREPGGTAFQAKALSQERVSPVPETERRKASPPQHGSWDFWKSKPWLES